MSDLRSVRLPTARLTLEAACPADAGALATYYTENAAHLMPWEPPRFPAVTTEVWWQAQLAQAERLAAEGSALRLLMRRRDEAAVVGVIGLSAIARGPFEAAILGYSLGTQVEGQGLMFEALEALVGWSFDTLQLHRLMANHLPENLRSARLLRRLGFVVEGYARDYLFIGDAWRDHVLTALTNPHPRVPAAFAP